ETDVAVSRPLEARSTVEDNVPPVRLEHGALAGERKLVALAPVVEAGLALEPERHLAPQTAHTPANPVVLGDHRRIVDGHEVDELSDPGVSHEAGNEACGLREVDLGRRAVVPCRRDPEPSAVAGIQQRGE